MARRTGRAVSRRAAFWDASALVPVCVRQTLTPRSLALYRTYEAVIWWGTTVEIASALARLLRMRHISSADWAAARRIAADLAVEWSTIQPADAVGTTASELVNRYSLRAADALQLAAALQWCDHSPKGRIFLTTDDRLREAALLAGFDTESI